MLAPYLTRCCVPHAATRAVLEAVERGGDEFSVEQLKLLEEDFANIAGSEGGALNRVQFLNVRVAGWGGVVV